MTYIILYQYVHYIQYSLVIKIGPYRVLSILYPDYDVELSLKLPTMYSEDSSPFYLKIMNMQVVTLPFLLGLITSTLQKVL